MDKRCAGPYLTSIIVYATGQPGRLRLFVTPLMYYLPPVIQIEENNEQQLLTSVKQYVANGPATLGLDDLAYVTGCSKKHLSSIFRKQYGISLSQFLREERMCRAQRLLVQTSLGVQEIAQRLGYSSTANFSNAFRDHVGMSPSDFREKAPIESITALQGSMRWSSSEL
ncbi:helix-turn-helix transcriptional regulator [Alcaligenaceae bacterium]|nr:helix-turn-helix transcriptional regulator [Alcaligenaceae bacterium]